MFRKVVMQVLVCFRLKKLGSRLHQFYLGVVIKCEKDIVTILKHNFQCRSIHNIYFTPLHVDYIIIVQLFHHVGQCWS